MLITKVTQIDYKLLKNLEDFRNLEKVGGFGKGWYIHKYWKKLI
ncbi:MAG: hypothetical protein ACQERZ_07360 [Fusobacteriota bacterium]